MNQLIGNHSHSYSFSVFGIQDIQSVNSVGLSSKDLSKVLLVFILQNLRECGKSQLTLINSAFCSGISTSSLKNLVFHVILYSFVLRGWGDPKRELGGRLLGTQEYVS